MGMCDSSLGDSEPLRGYTKFIAHVEKCKDYGHMLSKTVSWVTQSTLFSVVRTLRDTYKWPNGQMLLTHVHAFMAVTTDAYCLSLQEANRLDVYQSPRLQAIIRPDV